MSGRRDHDKPSVVAWSLSLAAHLGLSLGGVMFVEESSSLERPLAPERPSPRIDEIEVDLLLLPAAPDHAIGAHGGQAPSEPSGGGERLSRPDTGRAGRGGDALVSAPAPRDRGRLG